MSLITTISEFKKYIAIDANTKMATLQPYVDEAEQRYILPLLGQAFYDAYHPLYLASVAETPTPLSTQNAKLLPYIQRCLAYYSQLMAIPHLAVSFGDMGTRQHRGEDSDPAPRWLQEKLQFTALQNGDLAADKLLEFLENNATAVAGNYEQWFADAVANTRMSGYIVYGTTIASKHIPINNSRRVYLQIRNRIRDIETRIIPKLIGKDQYDELVTQLKTGSTTAANQLLLEKLQPIIAKRALFMQLQFMRVQITEFGVFMYSGSDDILRNNLATDADIKILKQQLLDEDEMGYLADENDLRQFILDNIASFPLIKSSAAYTVQPDPGPTWESKNDPDNKFFSV